MRLILFLSTSMIEWFAILSLIFLMFRFPIRGYIVHIIFTSLIISQLSFLLHDVIHVKSIAPIIQLFVLILFLWLMFRVHIIYSLIMATIGYISIIVIQTILPLVIQWLNIFTIQELIESHNLQYILSIIFSFITGCICLVFSRYGIGFSFVPDSEKAKFILKGENIAFLIVTCLAAVLVLMTCLILFSGVTKSILIFLGLMILILCLFLYLAFKRESTS
jgi:hypothetical protein